MRNYNFITARGARVELRIITEEMASADATKPCYDLALYVNGDRIFGGVDRIDHPEHGACIKPYCVNAYIQIPAEHLGEVDALVNEYRETKGAMMEQIAAEDDAYEAHRAGVLQMMAGR